MTPIARPREASTRVHRLQSRCPICDFGAGKVAHCAREHPFHEISTALVCRTVRMRAAIFGPIGRFHAEAADSDQLALHALSLSRSRSVCRNGRAMSPILIWAAIFIFATKYFSQNYFPAANYRETGKISLGPMDIDMFFTLFDSLAIRA